MAFGSFLSGLVGGNFVDDFTGGLLGSDYFKDYKHASKVFTGDSYANAPQFKFLFHVYFTLNTGEIEGLANVMPLSDNATIGVLVKTAELPSYSAQVKPYNQYNRKRYVQTGIEYRPVNIQFHDDGSDLVRSMWYNYMTYYYSDSRHTYDGRSLGYEETKFDFNKRDIYDNLRSVNDWGFNGDNANGSYKPNFFKDIKIYGLNRGNFVQYTLVNPIITDWQHDTFDYAQGAGTMTNNMTLQYEAVKYQRGNIGSLNTTEVLGFGDTAHYDREPSKLSKAGSTNTILGQSGLLDAGSSIVEDLVPGGDGKINILGAALTAGRTAYTWKDGGLSDAFKEEGTALVGGLASTALRSNVVTNALNGFSFPKSTSNNTDATTTNSNSNATSASNRSSVRTTSAPVNTQNNGSGVTSNGSDVTYGQTASGLNRQADPTSVITKLK